MTQAQAEILIGQKIELAKNIKGCHLPDFQIS
jgi:hypothetical protein